MKLLPDQPSTALYQVPQLKKSGALIPGIVAAMMFYFAWNSWRNQIDPCEGGRASHCAIAEFWSTTVDIPRYLADAELFAALGLILSVVTFLVYRR